MRPALHRAPLASLSLAVMLALATPLAGAQNTAARASQFYEDALQRFDKKDYAGAVVQLKNVLRLDGKNLSAQVLLGKALYEDGQVNAAEVAFTEAIRLGVNRAEVVVPMARAAMLQGRPDSILTDSRFALEGLPQDTQYEMLLLRASAATDLGEFRQALTSIDQARAIRPNDAASFRTEVPARIRSQQLKEALAAADRAVALAPNDAESHFMRGEALHVGTDLAKAQAAYDRTLSIDAAHIGALVARAGIHMDFGRLQAAALDVAEALKRAPREPRALYLKALIAEREGRAADARAALNEVTALIDPIPAQYLRYRPQTQMLGGMAHHGLGQREKAKPYLEGLLRNQPGNPVAKVLANIHLADRNGDAAVLVLDNYLRSSPGDPQALLLLANAHLTQGRATRAVQILREALQRGEQPALRRSLGLALVGAGRFEEAIKELEAALARDNRDLEAGYALGSLYVQSRQAQPALRVAQVLERAHPKNAQVQLLLGDARRLRGDAPGARTAFETALKLDPALLGAQVKLARVEMEAGNPTLAARHLDGVLARNDKHPEAVALMAELSERNGRLDQAERWYTRADEISGADNALPALALVDFHLRHRQLPKAQDALRRAQAKLPDATLTLLASARVALAAGDGAGARTVLARAATAAGFNVPQLTQIAQLQMEAGALQAAAHSLDKALNERPDHVPALAMRAELEIRAGELAAAEKRVRRIQALQPRSSLAFTLSGDLASARNQPEAALAAYRSAHEVEKSTRSFMHLFTATMRRDQPAGIRLAQQWVASNPRDGLVWRALADSQLNMGNLAGARSAYESLARLGVRDPDAFNNLAHVLLAQKDNAAALRAAEQAHTLAPTAAHVIGTLGWTAHHAGQNDRALQLLRDARLRDPGSADTRFYLATVLAAMGRQGEARTELTAALAPNSPLRHRAEAERLLASLR